MRVVKYQWIKQKNQPFWLLNRKTHRDGILVAHGIPAKLLQTPHGYYLQPLRSEYGKTLFQISPDTSIKQAKALALTYLRMKGLI